jgi:hypothetical protein
MLEKVRGFPGPRKACAESREQRSSFIRIDPEIRPQVVG